VRPGPVSLGLARIAPLLALSACTEPRFEFHGYSDVSSCQGVINAELDRGAAFLGGYETEDIENPGYVTELGGELFGEPVDIEVLCTPAGNVGSIHYYSEATDPADTDALWTLFSEELFLLFGEPTMLSSEVNRSLRFLCHSPSPILLDEWRLVDEQEGADEDEAVEHELDLAVVPDSAECLDDQRR
jgi:hypothetical protein